MNTNQFSHILISGGFANKPYRSISGVRPADVLAVTKAVDKFNPSGDVYGMKIVAVENCSKNDVRDVNRDPVNSDDDIKDMLKRETWASSL